ncbi:MAG: DUF58 domain-containing protein [Brevundimonas sp.]|nr:MAG: DUF58 domain-containing protein [Brevundimonas sp.]
MIDFLAADERARLKSLRLASRRAQGADGLGQHQSRSRGAGLEFAQYRAYERGDEPRRVDWKLYGRSDKFFVREAERESPVNVWVIIDASASMSQADEARPTYARLDAAKGLAQAIAEAALRQGDRFGWMALSAAGVRFGPASGGAKHRDRMLLDLEPLKAEGDFAGDNVLRPLLARIGARDLVVVLSDGFEPALVEIATKIASAGREVLFVEMLTAAERDFDFKDGRRFVDPETGRELLGDGPALRATFLRRFAEARAALHARLDAAGVVRTDHVLGEPLDRPLRRLFG